MNSGQLQTRKFSVHIAVLFCACTLLVTGISNAFARQGECCISPESNSALILADATENTAVTHAQGSATTVSTTLQSTAPASSVPATRTFWPWWLGALALGTLTVSFWLALRIPFGISSSWDKVIRWHQERDKEHASTEVANTHPDRLREAMLAETRAQFGIAAMENNAGSLDSAASKRTENRSAPVLSNLIFLIMVAAGGTLSALLNGGVSLSFDLGTAHRAFFGDGMLMWLALLIGGAISGFGVRMAGGCNSGHGLSGMATLEIGSIVTTASFFGTAIAVSFLIESVL